MTTQAAAVGEVHPEFSWRRWGSWPAHWFAGDAASCLYVGQSGREGAARLEILTGAELTPLGSPYGRICSFCHKAWQRRAA